MSSGARLLPPTLPPARGLAADGGRKSVVGNELIFELEWEPELLLERGAWETAAAALVGETLRHEIVARGAREAGARVWLVWR